MYEEKLKMISIVQENSIGVIENAQLRQSLLAEKELEVENFDYINSTVDDLLDYVDFSDVEYFSFIVVSKTKRLKQFVELLNTLSDTKFSLYNLDLEKVTGDINPDINGLQPREVKSILLDTEEEDLSVLQKLNSAKALITGIYPLGLNKLTIKHLYLSEKIRFSEISNSIVQNMAINSAIFIKDFASLSQSSSAAFPLYTTEDVELMIKQKQFISLSEKEYGETMNTFTSQGKLSQKISVEGLIDYASLNEINTFNRLFVDHDGFYIDFNKQKKLSNDIAANFSELRNALSEYNSDVDSKPEVFLYPLLTSIMKPLKIEQCQFITPYNYYIHPPVKTGFTNELIGIKSDSIEACYHIPSGKYFKVNETFLTILEADFKGMLESDYLRDKLDGDYEKIIQEYQGVIENVG